VAFATVEEIATAETINASYVDCLELKSVSA
jgi:hypothetical protein